MMPKEGGLRYMPMQNRWYQNFRPLIHSATEIGTDPYLQFYGGILALAHLVGFFHILKGPDSVLLLDNLAPVCWPILTQCRELRNVLLPIFPLLLKIGIGLSIISSFLFLFSIAVPTYTRSALIGLLILLFYHASLLFFDYRLKHNQHMIHFSIEFFYIFFRSKKSFLLAFIPLIYFFVGLLKLNPDWWTGIVITRKPVLIPWNWVPLGAKYVIALEVVFIWGLYSRKKWILLFVLSQLLLFHFTSFSVVAFYYPLLMYCLLTIYIPVFFDSKTPKQKISKAGIFFICAFSIFQLIPKMITRDSALTMQGRFMALHMYDALVECKKEVTIHSSQVQRNIELISWAMPRQKCEPVVFWNDIQNFCFTDAYKFSGAIFDAKLYSRRSSNRDFELVADLADVCRHMPTISIFYNSWVKEPKQSSALLIL